ncbi:MAG: hypothetical protein WAN11_10990 [Syntrophobacteraceae bacterium]
MAGKLDALTLAGDPSEREEDGATQAINAHGSTLPRFRGLLLCRRCDFCGTRISIHGEGDDSVVMRCPECQREYVFFDHPE